MNSHRLVTFCGVLVLGFLGPFPARAADAPADKPGTLDRDPHLIGWWKFDETAGKTAADASGKGHDAVLEGGLSFETHSSPGKIGNALRFDGNDGCVRVAGYKGVTGTQPRTVSAWIKTRSRDGEIVSWGLRDAGKMFTVCHIRGRIGVTPQGGYYYMKAGTDDDQWHHVVVVIREASPPNLHDDAKLYRDGNPAEIDDIGLLDLWPIDTGEQEEVRIGRRYKGLIDDLRIYDRALSDEEVAALFKLQTGRPPGRP
ncbi:MAG: LamG domain-containing protein [Tepidisphaerales bacterium]